ncbi:hypothetical protein [Demequina sp.]|uniref:hypothetical protein n=1 Tax=Demequina sp. TaxID=2050685 RepID=UPI003D09A27F
MSNGLQGAALVATICAPLVAALVFAIGVFVDRRAKKRAAFAAAAARARAELMRSGNWIVMPTPLSGFGGWQLRVFTTSTELAVQLPARRYGALAMWIAVGATRIGTDHNRSRQVAAIEALMRVMWTMQDGNRRALKRALILSRESPWPEGDLEPPIGLRVLASMGRWPLALLTLDFDFALWHKRVGAGEK